MAIVNDRVVTVGELAAVGPFSFAGGLKFDSLGRLVVSTSAPVFGYCNGVPMSEDGALCVSEA